ncbi:N-formylglutamate amidohydrolase [Burkholderia sp. Bp9140]|uniref:N-formylglutamate amidohydrolase n=1 Tax=Burkholderia sp. Bp9140 TaxID=2184572 RepID=UPI0021AB732C|nr:N-formylglutamate amidohydrolase [Burkholderia sp. Bp9140]
MFQKLWADIVRDLGLDDLHFHDLRHEAVSRLVEMGLSDQEVAAISGQRNTDWFLNDLYSFLPGMGITTILATHSRYVVDVNRDPNLVAPGAWSDSPITLSTYAGEAIYLHEPTAAEAVGRITSFHRPFHQRLEAEVDAMVENFGRVLVLDLHSFMGPTTFDVCLGNGGHCTTSVQTFQTFFAAYRDAGFSVGDNTPFRGGYIVRHYGRRSNVETLMIELRYPNYIDCSLIDEARPKIDYARLMTAAARAQDVITSALERLISL